MKAQSSEGEWREIVARLVDGVEEEFVLDGEAIERVTVINTRGNKTMDQDRSDVGVEGGVKMVYAAEEIRRPSFITDVRVEGQCVF